MKTNDLIAVLARQAGPAPQLALANSIAPTLALSAAVAVLLTILNFGALPAAFWETHTPWMKLAYGGLLAIASIGLYAQLARPVSRPRKTVLMAVTVVSLMALVGAVWWLTRAEPDRGAALMGRSWTYCPSRVVLLAAPTLAGLLLLMRRWAPTNLRAAGFAAGLAAGGVGMCVYAVSCGESSPTFVAVWYTVGALVSALLGAALGPRVLRW